jgi:hypothetical protein
MGNNMIAQIKKGGHMWITMQQLIKEANMSRRTYSHWRRFGIIKDCEVAENRTSNNEILVDINVIDKVKRVQKMMKDGKKFWDVVDYYNPVFFNGIEYNQIEAFYKLEISQQLTEDYTKKIWVDDKFIESVKKLTTVKNIHFLPEAIKYIDKDEILKRLFVKIPNTKIMFESKAQLTILIEITENLEYSFREEWGEVEKKMREKELPKHLKKLQ